MGVPLVAWLLWALMTYVDAQIAWTPISVAGNNQIDLWTQAAKGCVCPWDRNSHQCACCVEDGGCHCGKNAPNRCAQCGLEQHCNHMCNVSIVSTELTSKSGKTFGQIKSLQLEGPGSCWYTFIPTSSQRIEIQIYRLLYTGKHNGTNCVGGFLQLASGADPQYSYSDNQICGSNERFNPPVVFFSDDGLATLLFQITEKTQRSQFLAHFSFTSMNNTDGLGYQPKGGLKLQNTDCDWLYQESSCSKTGKNRKGLGPCVLASPSYPGLYPPYRQCKYHIRTPDERVRISITFVSVLLPQNRCNTDYINIYQGSTTSSPLLTTICGNQRKTFEHKGPDLLVEFSSGPQIPPYAYNGFLATLRTYEMSTTPPPTEATTLAFTGTSAGTTNPTRTLESSSHEPQEAVGTSDCDLYISGNNSRSGHFDTREHGWSPVCHLVFKGRPTDMVHVTFLNYRLTALDCESIIEVFDGSLESRRTPMEKICSPLVMQINYESGRMPDVKSFLSTGNSMIIIFKRPTDSLSTSEAEFLTGAYFFHDEQIGGTMQPNSICHVKYYGNNSPLAGMIDNPGSQQFYIDVDGPLYCKQEFIPASNQSVTVKILGLEAMSHEPKCVTQCGDGGCQCVSEFPLKEIDHISLSSEEGRMVMCLCGGFQSEWLPVSVRTWGVLALEYTSNAWDDKRFGFTASYSFTTDFTCGERINRLHSGEITMKNLSALEHLNHFYQQNCIWILHSNVERQLEIDISSTQNRPCTVWNISIHEYSADAKNHHLGDTLNIFCPRDFQKQYQLRWNLNTVVVRLLTLSRKLPQFRIKWKSHVVRANTKFGGPTPVPNASSGTTIVTFRVYVLHFMFLLLVETVTFVR